MRIVHPRMMYLLILDGIAGLDMIPDAFNCDYSIAIKIRPAKMRGWE